MQNPAIVVVAYNRLLPVKRLLSSIIKAKYPEANIPLIISIDHHPENQEIIEYAENLAWPYGEKRVQKHEMRMGLRPHVLECADNALEYGSVILLEDDVVVAEDYYLYTLAALKKYESDNRIAGISLYCNEWNNFARHSFRPMKSPYTTYFRQVCESWGECWSAEQWKAFRDWLDNDPMLIPDNDMPEEVYKWPETSWGKYFTKYVVEKDLFLVVPYDARSTCFSESGQHTAEQDLTTQVCLMTGIPQRYVFPDFEQGIHYDLFYENIDVKEMLKRWTNGEGIRMDINGIHTVGKERYLVSTKKLPYKRIQGYSLVMRPPEMNIIHEIPGNDLFLYDTAVHAKSDCSGIGIREYDLAGYNGHRLLDILIDRKRRKYKKKIQKLICNLNPTNSNI